MQWNIKYSSCILYIHIYAHKFISYISYIADKYCIKKINRDVRSCVELGFCHVWHLCKCIVTSFDYIFCIFVAILYVSVARLSELLSGCAIYYLSMLFLGPYPNPCPYLNLNPYPLGALYYMSMLFLGPFFVMQLIIVVIKEKFTIIHAREANLKQFERKQSSGDVSGDKSFSFQTLSQVVSSSFFELQLYVRNCCYSGQNSCLAFMCFMKPVTNALERLISLKEYEHFVMLIVLVNTFVLAFDHYPIDQVFSDVLVRSWFFDGFSFKTKK